MTALIILSSSTKVGVMAPRGNRIRLPLREGVALDGLIQDGAVRVAAAGPCEKRSASKGSGRSL